MPTLPTLQPIYEDGKSYMVKGRTLNDLINWIQRLVPIAGDGIELDERPNGTVIRSTATGGEAPAFIGQFCSIIPSSTGFAIVGGDVTAADSESVGNKAFTVAAGENSTSVVYVTINSIKAYTDDDNEIILSGIESSGSISMHIGSSYPSNTGFSSPTSSATYHVPLGTLQVTGGVPTFIAAGCGGIVVTQCGGSISHYRG